MKKKVFIFAIIITIAISILLYVLKNAGYNLMKLVNEDIINNKEMW